MKKLLKKTAITLMLILPVFGFAQSPADELFDKYSGEDGYTSVYITQHMFELFADIDNAEDEEQFSDLVKDLKCIKILSLEEDSIATPKNVNFYNEIMEGFPKQKYEELMVVKKDGQDIKFLIWKDGKMIKELLMIVGGDDENALISIQGNINLKTISKLSKSMNIEGMENLEKIEDK
jgi:hypothetical protein